MGKTAPIASPKAHAVEAILSITQTTAAAVTRPRTVETYFLVHVVTEFCIKDSPGETAGDVVESRYLTSKTRIHGTLFWHFCVGACSICNVPFTVLQPICQ